MLAVPVTGVAGVGRRVRAGLRARRPSAAQVQSRPLVRSLRAATTAIQDRLAATRPASIGAAGPALTGLASPRRLDPAAALNGYASTRHGRNR